MNGNILGVAVGGKNSNIQTHKHEKHTYTDGYCLCADTYRVHRLLLLPLSLSFSHRCYSRSCLISLMKINAFKLAAQTFIQIVY